MKTLWEAYRKTRSIEDRNALVEAYLPLLRKTVWVFEARFRTDFVGPATEGLIRAVETAEGDRFTAYARRCMRNACVSAIRATGNRPLHEARKATDEAAAMLGHELGHRPSEEELVEEVGDNCLSLVRRLEKEGNVSLAACTTESNDFESLLSHLTATQGRRARLRWQEGMTLAEIAKEEGVSVATVRSCFDGLFARLRKKLSSPLAE